MSNTVGNFLSLFPGDIAPTPCLLFPTGGGPVVHGVGGDIDQTGFPVVADTLERHAGQWRFGMKCHISVETGSGLVHTIEVTAANEHDKIVASKLIREDNKVVDGDSEYLGLQKHEEIQGYPHLASIDHRINRRSKSLPQVSVRANDWEWYMERRREADIFVDIRNLKLFDFCFWGIYPSLPLEIPLTRCS